MKCERGYNAVCILKSLHLLVFFVKEIKYFLDKKCFPRTIMWKTPFIISYQFHTLSNVSILEHVALCKFLKWCLIVISR
jgi:hypothetical protein